MLIKPGAIVGWRVARDGAMWRLTQLRLMETATEADGAYGEREVEQIRVLEPGRWEVHRKNSKGEWAMVEEAPVDPGADPVRADLRSADGIHARHVPRCSRSRT